MPFPWLGGNRVVWVLEVDRERGEGEGFRGVRGPTEDVDRFGNVNTREGGWRMRSKPEGPSPCSCSINDDLQDSKSPVLVSLFSRPFYTARNRDLLLYDTYLDK